MDALTTIDATQTPYAAQLYHNYYEQLRDSGMLKEEDSLLFIELCMVYEFLVRSRNGLLKDGLYQIDKIHGGMQRKSFNWQIYKDSMTTFSLLSKKFGLMPADREGFGKKEAKGFDLEDILGA